MSSAPYASGSDWESVSGDPDARKMSQSPSLSSLASDRSFWSLHQTSRGGGIGASTPVEALATRYVEHILGSPLPSNLHDSLKSGVRLIQLLKRLYPKETHDLKWMTGAQPANARANIATFLTRLKQCSPLAPTFSITDLDESGSISNVSECLVYISRDKVRLPPLAQTRPPRRSSAALLEDWELLE